VTCGSVQVLTDEMRVRQIVMNGLTNAVKYSNAPENGAIRVVVHTGEDDAGRANDTPHTAADGAAVVRFGPMSPPPRLLCIDVLDHGPGMRGVDEKVLFTDFLAPVVAPQPQSLTAGHTTVGSSGVGLPVCSR
jgi:signal transduction histidine kinase